MAKILIMDDEPGLRNVVFGMLKPTGHTIFVTEDGNQAIETAKKEKPDLALLDMRVPDMDGLEVVAHLKKMDPKIQCIMLSGFGDVESAVSAIKQGAFDYISKPFKLEEVLRVVNKALSTPGSAPASAPTLSSSASSSPSQVTQPNVPSSFTPAKTKVKKTLVTILGVAIIGIAGFFSWKFLGGSSKPSIYKIPYTSPSAITWDGKNIWLADWSTQTIYKHKADGKFSIESVFSLPDSHPTGLIWDGNHLWSCAALEKTITKHSNDASLSALVQFPNPLEEPSALTWDGINIWAADGGDGKLYKFKPVGDELSIAGFFNGAASQPAGMFVYQNSLWIADSETGKIYQHDPTNLAVKGIYALEPYSSKMKKLGGMAFDGKSIWTCTQNTGEVYKHSFKSLKNVSL